VDKVSGYEDLILGLSSCKDIKINYCILQLASRKVE
jgi:hypothetical protein